MTPLTTVACAAPTGSIEVTASPRGITLVQWTNNAPTTKPMPASDPLCLPHLLSCLQQIEAYFSGTLRCFHSLPLAYCGTAFELDVWSEVLKIPFGATVTYGEIARRMGRPTAARAVGQAVGRNPLLLLIPCHRILPHAGGIGHYSAGQERKAWLLEHEASSTHTGNFCQDACSVTRETRPSRPQVDADR